MPRSDLGRSSRFRLDAHRFYIVILEIDYEMANFGNNNNDNLWNRSFTRSFYLIKKKKKKLEPLLLLVIEIFTKCSKKSIILDGACLNVETIGIG